MWGMNSTSSTPSKCPECKGTGTRRVIEIPARWGLTYCECPAGVAAAAAPSPLDEFDRRMRERYAEASA